MSSETRRWLFIVIFGTFVIQAVPVYRPQMSTASTGEPAWPNDELRLAVIASCGPCHIGTESRSVADRIAPLSWWVEYRRREARYSLDFSDWSRAQMGAYTAADAIRTGRMPPRQVFSISATTPFTKEQRENLAIELEKLASARLRRGTLSHVSDQSDSVRP